MKTNIVRSIGLSILSILFASCANSGITQDPNAKPYPKNTCLVSNNRLGSMGTPITRVYQGQEVKFCCKPCVWKFEKDPARYLSNLH